LNALLATTAAMTAVDELVNKHQGTRLRAMAEAALWVALGLVGRLLGGAMFGGWRGVRWRPAWPAPGEWLRCFSGGAAMAPGSAFIPGSNEGLILVGMSLLWPYAWAAFLTMCASIAVALWLQRWRASEAA
jgi:toxin CptA